MSIRMKHFASQADLECMDRMDQYLRQIETVVFSQDEVVSAFAGTGMMGGTNSGIIFVVLLHPNQRKANQAEIKSRLRELVAEAVPNAHFAIENMSPMGHAGRNAEVQFLSLIHISEPTRPY